MLKDNVAKIGDLGCATIISSKSELEAIAEEQL